MRDKEDAEYGTFFAFASHPQSAVKMADEGRREIDEDKTR